MINIIINSPSQYQVNKIAVQTTVLEVLQRHNVHDNIEIGITIVGDKKMHEINRKYRGIDSTTNVLSFGYEDSIPFMPFAPMPKSGFFKHGMGVMQLGDIIISYPEAQRDAMSEGVSVDEELRELVEHGTKHLLGIHHE